APAAITIAAPIVLGAAQTWTVTDLASVLTASGAVSGSFGLTKSGAGRLILSGSNTFTNGLAINGGSVRLGNAGALNSTTPQAVSFGDTSNGVLQLFNQAAITLSGLTGDSTAIVENGGTTTNSVLTVNKSSGSDTFAGVLRNGSTSTLALTVPPAASTALPRSRSRTPIMRPPSTSTGSARPSLLSPSAALRAVRRPKASSPSVPVRSPSEATSLSLPPETRPPRSRSTAAPSILAVLGAPSPSETARARPMTWRSPPSSRTVLSPRPGSGRSCFLAITPSPAR
ncbi:MAG: hypothetical protein EBS65_21980, partial [Betaproteobacteria bacterium]|nr:hypothetical protein [Betaproteobacteria bacterium]